MLGKRYRLTSNAQIDELRQHGRSWHNRWFVLVKRANDRQESRFAFSVSRRIGRAVVRNRLKRVMRECIRLRLASICAGWDILLIARLPAREAQFEQTDRAIADLLLQSRLRVENTGLAQAPEDSTGPTEISGTHGNSNENGYSMADPALPKDAVPGPAL
jgi:ribonuclease P protein component